MGLVEMLAVEGADHAVNANVLAKKAAASTDPDQKYQMLVGARTAAQAAVTALQDAENALIGGVALPANDVANSDPAPTPNQ